jgi:hypothetical protein
MTYRTQKHHRKLWRINHSLHHHGKDFRLEDLGHGEADADGWRQYDSVKVLTFDSRLDADRFLFLEQ